MWKRKIELLDAWMQELGELKVDVCEELQTDAAVFLRPLGRMTATGPGGSGAANQGVLESRISWMEVPGWKSRSDKVVQENEARSVAGDGTCACAGGSGMEAGLCKFVFVVCV